MNDITYCTNIICPLPCARYEVPEGVYPVSLARWEVRTLNYGRVIEDREYECDGFLPMGEPNEPKK